MSAVESLIAADLVDLTEQLDTRGHEAAHGLLGGAWGYGTEFENGVFEMHPHWWGDCECGYEDAASEWEDDNPHHFDCYQAELGQREGPLEAHGKYDPNIPVLLAMEWGLPYAGCAVHCTCGQQERWEAWSATNDHEKACPVVRPNFRHKPSGFEVRWYKYIGRSMEYNQTLSAKRWREIQRECNQSIQDAA